METILQDLKFGTRLLIRQRGFSLVAILTLALGIGMTTAIASVIDAAMLHPLPYNHPEELVELLVEAPNPQNPARPSRYGPSAADLEALRSLANPPLSVGMWRSISARLAPITDGPEPERLRGYQIDANYLSLFGVTPIRGRGIQESDMREGAPPVVMIGHAYWQRRYEGRDDVIGQQLKLDNENAEIIGVLPKHFERRSSIWRPLRILPNMRTFRGSGAVTYGRLLRGLTIDQAQQEITGILKNVPAAGQPMREMSARLTTLLYRSTSGYWTTATILLGAVVLILLIACVNVAGLLLARGSTRFHEMGIRASIGAGRARLVRQLLTESVVIALAGAFVGILLAWWTLESLVANIPLPISSDVPATLNWRVLSLSLALSLVTGILFGLAPALRLSGRGVNQALSGGTNRVGSALSRRGGQWLIGAEVALALVLMTGAGLMLRSFGKLMAEDLGFDPGTFVTLESSPSEVKSSVFATYYTGLVETIRQWPDVEAVGAVNHLPLMGSYSFAPITLDTGTEAPVTLRKVLPGYFEAIGLSAVQGRLPAPSDVAGGRRVAVINQRALKQLFPDGIAAGRVITVAKEAVAVVGVVRNLRNEGGNDSGMPKSMSEPVEVFVSYQPAPTERPESMIVVVKPKAHAPALEERLREAARTAGPRIIVERVRTGTDWLADTAITPRRRTVLLGLLGGLGLLLTLVGVFGMTAYAVARRTREIGVRIAFGATAGHVIRTMLRDSVWPATIGLIAGLVTSWFATRVIASFLFETTPTDLPTFVGAAGTLAAAVLLAAWIPARRAARVDPVTSLRAE